MFNDLESAIQYCEEVADYNEEQAKIYDDQDEAMAGYSCQECASENRQLSDWLRELEAYREAREKIQRKANSGQWSEAVVYGLTKAITIIDKCLFAHNCEEEEADE